MAFYVDPKTGKASLTQQPGMTTSASYAIENAAKVNTPIEQASYEKGISDYYNKTSSSGQKVSYTPNPTDLAKNALGNLANTPAPQSADDIYKSKAAESSDLINKISNQFSGMIGDAQQEGRAKTDEANMKAAAMGLVGSSEADTIGKKTQTDVRGLQDQKATQIASALKDVQDRTDAEVIRQQDLYQNAQKDVITNAKNVEDLKKQSVTDAKANLDTLATAGKTAEQLKQFDFDTYQKLKEQTGMSDYEMMNYIDNNPNNPNKPIVKEVPMPSEDGTGTTIKRITFDPTTGKTSETDWNVNVPFASFQGEGIQKTSDGKVFVQQPDGSYKDVTPDISAASTTNQKDYEYYAKQEKSAGRTPLDFDTWTTNSKAPAAVKEFIAAQKAGFKGSIIEYQQQKKGATGSTLDADTMKFFADKYLTDGQMPSFGMGVAGMTARAQFYKMVADSATTQGKTGAQVSATIAGTAAAKTAMGLQQKLLSTTTSAEQAALKNAELAYNYGKSYQRVGDLNLANKWHNWVNGQVSSASLSKFELALFTASREYAKVSSGAAGSVAGLTDSAMKEAEKLLNSAMTQEQLRATIDAMKLDMENVTGSMKMTMTDLQDQISNSGGSNTGTPTPNNTDTPTPTGDNSGDTNFNKIWN